MIFARAATHAGLDLLRFVSTNARWEIGLKQMFPGSRVRLLADGQIVVDYCAGNDAEQQQMLVRAVMLILLPQAEDADVKQVCGLFPLCRRMPIFLDDECWDLLQECAVRALAEA